MRNLLILSLIFSLFVAIPAFAMTKSQCSALSSEIGELEQERASYLATTTEMAHKIRKEGGIRSVVENRVANLYRSRKSGLTVIDSELSIRRGVFYRDCNPATIESDEPVFEAMAGYDCTVVNGVQRCAKQNDNEVQIKALEEQVKVLMALLAQLLAQKL